MGMLYETEFDDGTLSRDRDPVVPRGSVVAGEDRGVGVVWRRRMRNTRPGGEEGPWSYFDEEPPPLRGSEDGVIVCDREPLTPLLPTQERIRALEEERDRLTEANRTARELATARLERILEREARLEEIRPVVRAALTYSSTDYFSQSLGALSPATRAWAEGSK